MAEVKIVWSEEALKDIEEIISFISKDSELYAVNFASKIISAVEKVSYYLLKLKKWFEERNITFELNSSNCDLWYPERKIV